MSETTPGDAGRVHRTVPQGYRQGLITAITVLLGFSLTFLRYWGFEAPGQWDSGSIVSTVALGAAVLLQLVALIRSLRLEDDDPVEYRRTCRYLTCSVGVLLVALVLAAYVIAQVPEAP